MITNFFLKEGEISFWLTIINDFLVNLNLATMFKMRRISTTSKLPGMWVVLLLKFINMIVIRNIRLEIWIIRIIMIVTEYLDKVLMVQAVVKISKLMFRRRNLEAKRRKTIAANVRFIFIIGYYGNV